MKLFDPRAALLEIRNQSGRPATIATIATKTTSNGPSVADVATVATPPIESPKSAEQAGQQGMDDMRHGFSISGSPKTWTGRIVCSEEWWRLSEWQKHGPDGRIWCADRRAWVKSIHQEQENGR